MNVPVGHAGVRAGRADEGYLLSETVRRLAPRAQAERVKFVFHEPTEDVAPKGTDHFPADCNRFDVRRELLTIGAFTNRQQGAIGIFTTKEAAEEFVEDPERYEIIRRCQISECTEILAS